MYHCFTEQFLFVFSNRKIRIQYQLEQMLPWNQPFWPVSSDKWTLHWYM